MTSTVSFTQPSCSSTQAPLQSRESARTNTDQKVRLCSWESLKSKALALQAAQGMQEVYPIHKMRKNACKAVSEHQSRDPQAPIPTNKEIKSYVAKHPRLSALDCKSEVYEQIGTRHSDMEDISFYSDRSEGLLTGVFDGHGNASVAMHCASQFTDPFVASIAGESTDVRSALHARFDQLNAEVLNIENFNEAGATGVVTYLDKARNQIFAATLGDSEAFIFRNFEKEKGLQAIPLSCVRDWTSPKDSERLLVYRPRARINFALPKHNRFPFPSSGINVARSIGDKDLRNTFASMRSDSEKAAPNPLSSKPKVASARIYPGDIVVVGSDGLTDALSISEMAEAIESFNPAGGKTLASTLGELASAKIDDDVTVRVIYIGADQSS